MDREEIRERLRAFPYDQSGYWLAAGGAMVWHGLREQTADIDLGCSTALAERLEADGFLIGRTEDGQRRFRCGELVEVFENWLCGGVETLDGLPVVTLQGLLEMKRALGREKDRQDIERILARLDRWESMNETGDKA